MSKVYIGSNSTTLNQGATSIHFQSIGQPAGSVTYSTITRIGSVDVLSNDSTSRVTTGVTVPEGTDIAIISCVYGINIGSIITADSDEVSLGSITATTINEEADAQHGTAYACYVVNPPTGTEITFAVDQTANAPYGPWWTIIYYSGVNTSDPIYSSMNHVFSTSIGSNLPRTYENFNYPTSGMSIGVWWTWSSSPQPSVNISGQTEVYNEDMGNPNRLVSERFESDYFALNNGTYVSLVGFSLNPSTGVT